MSAVGRSRARLITAAVGILLVTGTAAYVLLGPDGDDSEPRAPLTGSVMDRACALPPVYLDRIANGYDPARSEEIAIVPREPNFIGTFDLTSHSGPWDYLQRVPLILYGPKFIRAQGDVDAPATHADIYPTVGELVDVDLEERTGRALVDSLRNNGSVPRLVVLVVWDGAGRATLEGAPDAWPSLGRLVEKGTSYIDATVGSSPSVTSAVHSTMGTGTFPAEHGVIGNELRNDSGGLDVPFARLSADALRTTTFADDVDVSLGNRSKVGMLAWNKWHLGMLGHGSTADGGDKDELALIHYANGLQINSADDYSRSDVGASVDPFEELEQLDRADGTADGKWLGNDISLGEEAEWDTYSNPAWADVQAQLAVGMLKGGRYGLDEVPDIWLTNFKMTDLAAHQWGRDAPETTSVLAAQDEALGHIVEYLDRRVRDYVLVLTADHGSAPDAEVNEAWPIDQAELIDDVDENFGVPDDRDLIESAAAAAYFIDREVAEELGVSFEEISDFLNDYTIEQNWPDEELPDTYEGRGAEQVFSAAFPTEDLDAIRECAEAS